jgi:hypothetical protein
VSFKPTRVVHVQAEPYDISIMRPSKWSNPFSHRTDTRAKFIVKTRAEAIEKYEKWIKGQPALLADLPELWGRTLGCCCRPLACHGTVLARLANESRAKAEGMNAG